MDILKVAPPLYEESNKIKNKKNEAPGRDDFEKKFTQPKNT